MLLHRKGKIVPTVNEEREGNENNLSVESSALEGNGNLPKADDDKALLLTHSPNVQDEESSCATTFSDESGVESVDLPRQPIQLDKSAFLDEDSNQPMPVDRFFGNVAFMQDLPAAALTCTTMSRRELRKLHFIAKDDDDDDDNVL
uniref:CA174 protein n=1 Tax=Sphenodon punctatus TaxID=8508 RepID=A0A8D0H2U5_SPHPU